MKTRFILLSVLILFGLKDMNAQEKKVALGLGISPTLNWMKTKSEGLTGDGSRIGFKYGLMADFNFGENYALSTGVFINNAGGKVKALEVVDTLEKNVSYVMKIQSIEIPLTLKMKTKEIGYLKYFGQFGFAPEIIINSTADISVEGQEKQKNVDMKDRVTNLDLSLVLGIGVEYNLSGTTNFVIGVSYQNGFIDMLKGSADGFNDVEKK
ncbi:MAG TPA: hypothetical protein DCX54_01785, partial [Flavobacteriales bacterium]|nr:hypothetical protein [Flavobacteriales bacterium]